MTVIETGIRSGTTYLKGGKLSLETHDGQYLKWIRLYLRNRLKSITKSWDCCLIEIEVVPDLIPVSITVISKDFWVHQFKISRTLARPTVF
jgi:hypothetical protein